MRIFRFLLLLLAGVTFAGVPAVAGEKIGVVLMHGKNRTASEKSPIAKFAYALEVADFIVAEIDRAVANLKDKGASKIVVGGHSLGANAALGCGARREGLAGILAIAPGAHHRW